jgi:hypothetical protein
MEKMKENKEVRNLIPSDLVPFKVFRDVVAAKHSGGGRKDRLTRRIPAIRGYYRTYGNAREELSVLCTHRATPQQKADLEHCYKKRTKPLNDLLGDIEGRIPDILKNKCPYCDIEWPRTWDHYLPTAYYPEFSTHALNLLPSCHFCNELKGNRFLNNNGERQIVHLYFDRIPAHRYLQVQLERTPASIPLARYSIIRPPRFAKRAFRLINEHFSALDLLARYREAASAELAEKSETLRPLLHTDARIRNHLLEEANILYAEISPNYWRAVLYEAMAQDAVFVANCL